MKAKEFQRSGLALVPALFCFAIVPGLAHAKDPVSPTSEVAEGHSCATRKDLPATLIDAETVLRSADDNLERARQRVADARAAVERATSGVGNTTVADATRELEQASKAMEEAEARDEDAIGRHECVERRLMEARTWRYAFMVGGHGAVDAAGTEKWGAQASFVWHPYGLECFRELEGVARWSRQSPGGLDREWSELILRVGIPFGSAGTLSLGPGLALPLERRSETPHVAITGDVGIGYRFGQWLRWTERTGVAGGRIFMQPWFTADRATSVLFGVELTLGYGWDRIGRIEDLSFGKDVTFRADPKP